MSFIAPVTISAHSYQSFHIVSTIQISSNIVKYIQILLSIDQYCPVVSCLDVFPLKLALSHFKSDLDAVKISYMQASSQVCRYARLEDKRPHGQSSIWTIGHWTFVHYDICTNMYFLKLSQPKYTFVGSLHLCFTADKILIMKRLWKGGFSVSDRI